MDFGSIIFFGIAIVSIGAPIWAGIRIYQYKMGFYSDYIEFSNMIVFCFFIFWFFPLALVMLSIWIIFSGKTIDDILYYRRKKIDELSEPNMFVKELERISQKPISSEVDWFDKVWGSKSEATWADFFSENKELLKDIIEKEIKVKAIGSPLYNLNYKSVAEQYLRKKEREEINSIG